MPGARFGPYQLVELLGRGGMGEVWRAVDTSHDDRVVALKLLGAWLGMDSAFERRFRREAALAAKLGSPHVVPIHRYGEIEGRLYLDMQFVAGIDLATLLERDGALPVSRAVGILIQAARGLAAAHEARLVHRDVKPSNILVTTVGGEDHVYVIDFGIACSVDGASVSSALIGTPTYMAPERFEGSEDHRADIYALGAVLYETLTGQPPFPSTNSLVLMNNHQNTPPPRPSSLRPNLPAGLDEVVVRAMAKQPSQRYASVDAFATAVRDALAHTDVPSLAGVAPPQVSGGSAHRDPAVQVDRAVDTRATGPVALPPPPPTPRRAAAAARTRSRSIRLAVIAALTALGLVAAAFLLPWNIVAPIISGGGGGGGGAPVSEPPESSTGAETSAGVTLGWGEPNVNEEFDGPLGPEWQVYDGPGHVGNGIRSPQAVDVSDGILTITGDSEGTTGGLALFPGQMYGRWEGRVRTPPSDETYNALLLLWPDAEDWPQGGEVDFMEMLDPTRQETSIFIHYGEDDSRIVGDIRVDATQWHNWAVEWTPEHIVAYLDGREWYRTADSEVLPPREMHLAIQFDWFPEQGDPADVRESTMEVDWVKQYPYNP